MKSPKSRNELLTNRPAVDHSCETRFFIPTNYKYFNNPSYADHSDLTLTFQCKSSKRDSLDRQSLG
jgi:hypothetical protein